jgi:hypothetical protein
MKLDVYIEDKGPTDEESYRYEATAFLPLEVSRASVAIVGYSDDSGAHAYRQLLRGLIDLRLVESGADLTVVHDDTGELEPGT